MSLSHSLVEVKGYNRFRVSNANRLIQLIYNLNINSVDITAYKRKTGEGIKTFFNDFFMRILYFMKKALQDGQSMISIGRR